MAEQQERTGDLELLTITRLWNFQKHLHNFGGVPLRFTGPISHRTIVYAAAVFGPVLIFTTVLQVPWLGIGTFFQATLPTLLVWWALRKAAEGANPVKHFRSWARYYVRVVHELVAPSGRPVRIASRARVRAGVPAGGLWARRAGRVQAWAERVVLARVVRVLVWVSPIVHVAGLPVEPRPVVAGETFGPRPRPVVSAPLPVEPRPAVRVVDVRERRVVKPVGVRPVEREGWAQPA